MEEGREVNKPMYPDDGGLREPVRPFEKTPGVFDVLRDHFRVPEHPTSRHSQEFVQYRVPRLFYSSRRKDGTGGHMRLFGDKPGKGWVFYSFHNQAGAAPGWALHRVWNFCLFVVHHIGPGKSTEPEGWHITRARLKIAKVYHGFSITWQAADTFRTKAVR